MTLKTKLLAMASAFALTFSAIGITACAQQSDVSPDESAVAETGANDAVAEVAASEAPAVDPAADPANWRVVEAENLFVFETTKGTILIEAFPFAAPAHVEQFRKIIRSGDYDGTVFHRVIDDFMAQGGDIMTAKGRPSGEPDLVAEFTFERDPFELAGQMIGVAESGRFGFIMGAPINTQSAFLAEMNETGTVTTNIMHCPGVVSTARTDDPNSANSQFFLMRETSPHLDEKYTAWGRAVVGLDVVRAIKAGTRADNGAVSNPDVLVSAKVAADMGEDERPVVYVQRTDGPRFAEMLAAVDPRENVCNLDPVPAIRVR